MHSIFQYPAQLSFVSLRQPVDPFISSQNLIKQQQLWWSMRTKYFFPERFLFVIFVDYFFPHLMLLFSPSNVLPNWFNLQFHLHLSFVGQWRPFSASDFGNQSAKCHYMKIFDVERYTNGYQSTHCFTMFSTDTTS